MSLSDQVSMFYNAKPHIFEKAKALRATMTQAEVVLWERLKGKQVLGLKFRSQHPIDIFIAGFYCHQIQLVIEVDGEIHNQEDHLEYDVGREAELNNFGIEVIRFSNEIVITNIEYVVNEITDKCRKLLI